MVRLLLCMVVLLSWTCQSEPRGRDRPLTIPLGPDTVRKIQSGGPSEPFRYDYDTTAWTDLRTLEAEFVLDLRYATTNNFTGEILYPCGRCFLRPRIAERLLAAHRALRARGYGGLMLFDCYRPRSVQWKLWENVSDKRYVADPRRGSMHNRGAAVDLTIVDAEGQPLDMGTAYDHFGPEAHWSYADLPASVQQNRRLLLEVMRAEGFQTIRTEWWHYSLPGFGSELSDFVWPCP